MHVPIGKVKALAPKWFNHSIQSGYSRTALQIEPSAYAFVSSDNPYFSTRFYTARLYWRGEIYALSPSFASSTAAWERCYESQKLVHFLREYPVWHTYAQTNALYDAVDGLTQAGIILRNEHNQIKIGVE